MDPRYMRELAEWLALREGPTPAERAAWATFAASHLPRIGDTILVRLPSKLTRREADEPFISSAMAADLDRWFQL